MRTKKTIKNLIFNLFQQIIGIITNFIIPPIIIGKFGSAVNGLISTIKQIINYVQLTGAGISSASTYALYKPLADNNNQEINEIYNGTKKMFIKAGNIFSFIVFAIAIIYPIFLGNEIEKYVVFLLVVIMGAAGMSEFYFVGKYQALLNADQKNFVVAIAQSIGNIFNVLFTIILIKLNMNIVTVQLGATIIYLMRVLIITTYVKKHYQYINEKIIGDETKISQRNDAIVHEITALIVNNSSIVLVSIFLDLKFASVFSVYALVFSGLNVICSIVSNAIYASFGEVIAKNDTKVLKSAFNLYEWFYYIAISILYIVAVVMIIPFVSVYTKGITDINYILPVLGILFAINGFINNIKIPARTLVIASGHFKQTKKNSLIEMILNVVFQLIFIYFFGIYGTMLGCIVANVYRTIDFVMYSNKNIIKENNQRMLKRSIINIVVGILIILGVNLILNIQVTSYLSWAIYALIITITATIIYLIISLIFERTQVKELGKLIKGLFKKNV